MKERPILFRGPMVRAILEGRKTQTRRVVKNVSGDCELFIDAGDGNWQQCYRDESGAIHSKSWLTRCQYGVKGDRLWVRETFGHADEWIYQSSQNPPRVIAYRADLSARDFDCQYNPDTSDWGWKSIKWRPSIHMPRWASRITLEITGIRVERLQDISGPDCWAEGIDHDCEKYGSVVHSYQTLWESINGPGSWDANPWVWVIEFKRI